MEGGNRNVVNSKILKNSYSGEIRMKLDGKNKHNFLIRDLHNRTGFTFLGGVEGISSTLESSRISTSYRYVIDISRLDPIPLGSSRDL